MAAWIRHASRTLRKGRGVRVSNATVTYPKAGDSRGKLRVIPGDASGGHPLIVKGVIPPWDGPLWYQLDGEVIAHHGLDAYRACERGPAHWD